MIAVQLSERDFEYDIYSLVRAFYPGMEVTVYLDGEPEPEGYEKRLTVRYGQDFLELELTDAAGKILEERSQVTPGQEDRRETKNILKRLLYEMLQDYTGQTLPWGNLTGIRPTKIAMSQLEQGRSEPEIIDYMKKTYYASEEKSRLAVQIAQRERGLLQKIHYENGYSLYVGIPFCPSICLYCSFSSSPIGLWKDRVDNYLDALCREIEGSARICAGQTLDTIYIGGGTPTTLEPEQMDRLLTRIESCFDLSHLLEFTVEAGRPDSITEGKLQVLREHGIDRISINPQTMNQKTLDLIGRKHTVEQIREAFHLARRMGFSNINMDLIVGLPGEDYPEVERSMQEVTALDPDSITVHSLAVKRAARLNIFRDQYKEMTFTNNRKIMEMTDRYARQAGHSPYYLYRQKNMAGNFENVGYAKPGAAGLYNILIMEEKQSILALGAGAKSKKVTGDRIERRENVKDIRNYIDRVDEMIDRKRCLLNAGGEMQARGDRDGEEKEKTGRDAGH